MEQELYKRKIVELFILFMVVEVRLSEWTNSIEKIAL